MQSAIKLSLLGAFMVITCAAFAQGPRSTAYTFEYAAVANSGSATLTSSYEVVSQVKLSGFAGAPASSSNYSVEPVTAYSADAAVDNWTLY